MTKRKAFSIITRLPRALVLIAIGTLSPGCSKQVGAACDMGVDAACDMGAQFLCVPGSIGGSGVICGDLGGKASVCAGGEWRCPDPDNVPLSQCTCMYGFWPPQRPCSPACTASGWICVDAGTESDASNDIGPDSDAGVGGDG